MKIKFICWAGALGGAEIALLRLIDALDRQRFEVSAWLFRDGPLRGELTQRGVPVTCFNVPRIFMVLFNPVLLHQLTRKLRSESMDIVHGVGTAAYLIGAAAAKKANTGKVWWLVDRPNGRDRYEKRAGKLRADLIVCNSQATSRAFRERYPGNDSLCEVVYPSVEASQPVENGRAGIREALNIPGDSFVILSASRFQKWKGLDVLAECVPQVTKRLQNAVFIFAGQALPGMEDGTEQRVRDTVRAGGCEARCRFLGFRKDIPELMKASDLIVHTSLSPEPFGLVVAEAMALGRPVLASREGGPAEIIEHQTDGWLIEPGKPAALAEAIVHLAEQPALRNQLAARAAVKAAEKFSGRKAAERMQRLYLKIREGKNA